MDRKFLIIQDDITPGKGIGIRMERAHSFNKVEFHTSNKQTVEIWREILEKKINQRNFHQLFKAKKKIGKGAFATVYLAERLIDN